MLIEFYKRQSLSDSYKKDLFQPTRFVYENIESELHGINMGFCLANTDSYDNKPPGSEKTNTHLKK